MHYSLRTVGTTGNRLSSTNMFLQTYIRNEGLDRTLQRPPVAIFIAHVSQRQG
jgi:hypothetical protein